jgi:excisionase family DNA binding protein
VNINTKPPAANGDIAANYFTAEELASELNISLRTLRQWHLLRKGPPRLAVGRLRLFHRQSVSSWLASKETAEPRRRT